MSPAEEEALSGAASLLFANGETTRRTAHMVSRLGSALGLNAELLPAWGAMPLRLTDAHGGTQHTIVFAEPLGVEMNKVAQAEHLISGLQPGQSDPQQIAQQLQRIKHLPPASTLRFVLMCAAGCAALGIIFGINNALTLGAIAITALTAGLVRRGIARFTEYPLLQPLVAAFINGLFGAFAAHARIENAQWVAVVPCIILVPGPHLLNGCLDLARGHAVLGIGRLAYAGTALLMICIGILCGLAAGGASLPVAVTFSPAPLLLDVAAAGVAVAAFGSFFSMPWQTLYAPVAIGMTAHAIRWAAMHAGANVEFATFAACLTVGVLVTLSEDRLKMPFAAMAFAASVSMIPGFYLFHMASGLLFAVNRSTVTPDHFLNEAILNGTIAFIVFVTIAFGLLAPKLAIEHFRPSTH